MSNPLTKLKKAKWKHFVNYFLIAAFLIYYLVSKSTGGVSRVWEQMFVKFGVAMILAISLNLVVGYLGELSLGHAGFMCLGAYSGGKLAVILSKQFPAIGLDNSNGVALMVVTMIAGGLVAAVFGAIVCMPALRLKGDYLAIVTLAFGQIVSTLFQQSSDETFGGALGLSTPTFGGKQQFVPIIVAFVCVLITLAVIQNLMRSKHGRAITAIRDNEIAAKATGVNVTKYKLVVFVISAFFAGVAGAIFSFYTRNVNATTFDYNYSINMLVMVVLGGIGNMTGSMISAVFITILDEILPTLEMFQGPNADRIVLKNIIYALILILVVIYGNAPALKGFREKYNLQVLFAKLKKKKKADPSVVKDDAAHWANIPTKIKMDEVLSVDVTNTDVYTPDKPDRS